ncbi:hypothetical protein PAAG_11983 [Paracoccidioides lutzii Pb01]|uniref:BolA domain-containing protein n=1 Tax=Paracoccidioides lutzii (strain ATCC MYA-826 / Pb01) TaxID=502779 RepID=A0A0A2V0I0_PARBA|nr:hypothetical protein PAAG_11983 [Paracoccidioides lutzii Pb01]KGQ01306.1 hypothetical protein PAAG_11983 [Paracoccidioides lutzii Pb01]
MFLRPTNFSRSCFYLIRQHRPFYFTAGVRSALNASMTDTANTSGVSAASIKDTLIAKLDAQHVEIEDMSGGCGQAFQAIIVSRQFDKKTMLARHRLVNSVLKAEIAAIHAWTPKCYTPEQWENEQKAQS